MTQTQVTAEHFLGTQIAARLAPHHDLNRILVVDSGNGHVNRGIADILPNVQTTFFATGEENERLCAQLQSSSAGANFNIVRGVEKGAKFDACVVPVSFLKNEFDKISKGTVETVRTWLRDAGTLIVPIDHRIENLGNINTVVSIYNGHQKTGSKTVYGAQAINSVISHVEGFAITAIHAYFGHTHDVPAKHPFTLLIVNARRSIREQ